MRAERHPRESERVEALRRYRVLDTPRETEFDDLAALASRICETPIALVTMLDAERLWFKAAVGTEARELPAEGSFCSYAILESGLLEISDLREDVRFANDGLVSNAPFVRFYAGIALETPEGLPLGTLCVLDTKPRVLTDLQRETLRVLAGQVITGLELRRRIQDMDEERQRVAETLERAEVATWRSDLATGLLDGNCLMHRFFGIEGPATQEQIRRAMHRQDLATVRAAYAEFERTGRYEAEFRATGSDGVERWILARGELARDENGEPRSLTGVAVDTTERRRTALELAAERHQFRELLDEVPAHVVTLRGEDLRYEFANRAFLEFLNRDPDFIGVAAREAWPVPDEHIAMLNGILETGEPVVGREVPVPFPSEPERLGYFDFIFQPLREADGAVSGVFVHSVDVTEKVLARRLVAESEERFRIVAQATRDAIWDCDLSTDAVWWNEGITELFGSGEVEPTGAWWIEHIHPDDRERVLAGVQTVLDQGLPDWTDEYRFTRADGTEIIVDDRGFVIFSEGKPIRMVGAMADVTEQRMAQRRLEVIVADRTAELREAVREAESFNYSISHDLRTPLRAISATSQILLDEGAETLSPGQLELLERQAHNARRLGLLIDQLLLLSRLGRVEMVRKPLDLTNIARSVVAEILQANEHWTCEIDVQDGMRADGDSALVRLVLSNLIENACKFSGGKGPIRVRQSGGEFRVEDEGVGFDMRYAEKLFLPFERLVKESEFPGTGIGLANVERIVRRHGGKVWAESQPGEGAVFSFTLK